MSSHRFSGRQVVVTGGASFIGSHLVDRLLEEGASVTVIDNFSSGLRSNLSEDSVKIVEMDLAGDPSSVESAFRESKADFVFHLAAVHGGRGFIETFPHLMLVNLRIDNNVFTACQASGVEMVVHASSACAYPVSLQEDVKNVGWLEESQANFDVQGCAFPDGTYGWMKLIGELQLSTLCSDSGMHGRSARIFTAFGPRENESHAAIALIAKSLLRLDPFPVWGSGDQTRNFTFVADTVEGLMRLGLDGRSVAFEAVNVGSNVHTRVLDFTKLIHEVVGWAPTNFDFQLDKPVGVAARAADNTKILRDYGWSPSTDLRSALEETCSWYESKPERPNTLEELNALLFSRG